MGKWVAVVVVWVAGAGSASAGLVGYHIGNSLTVDSNPWSLDGMAAQRGTQITAGHHIRAGMGLPYLWANPDDPAVLYDEEFGTFDTALPSFALDYLTLQPYPSPSPCTLADDITAMGDFTGLLRSNPANANTRVYLYAPWPGRPVDVSEPYADRWLVPAVDSPTQLTTMSRQYFDILAQHTGLRQIPVGEVLYQLDLRLRAGELPGYEYVWRFYRDWGHLNAYGQYIALVTTFTTLTNRDPAGLTAPEGFGPGTVYTQAFYDLVHEVVWDVAALRGDFTADGDINALDVHAFIAALTNAEPNPVLGDLNRDGNVNAMDISDFVALLTQMDRTMPVPEPAMTPPLLLLWVLTARRGRNGVRESPKSQVRNPKY